MAPTNDAIYEVALDAARFRSLAEATADIVWRTDAHGAAVDLGRWYAVTGQSRAEADGYGWLDVVHADDLMRVRQEWSAALRECRSYTSIYRVRLVDGRYRRFRTRGVPLLGDDGRVAEWVGVSSDVEDRLASEEALRASEARFRSLAEATAQIVWRTTPDSADIAGYADWSAFTGVQVTPESSPDEWFSPVHPDDRGPLAAAWSHGRASGQSYEHPYRVRAADGSWRTMIVRAVPVRAADGTLTEWVGTHTDVTEREAARTALERERAMLAEAQRIGRLGSWSWNMVTGETWVSDEVHRIFGMSPAEVEAAGINAVEAFDRMLVPDDRIASDAKRQALFAGRVPESSDQWRIVRPDGQPRVVVTRSEWTYAADGRPTYASGTVHDVTELVAAAEALRASEERFRLAAQATRDTIYEYDTATGAVWTSASAREAFRKPADHVSTVGAWLERVHPEDRMRVQSTLDAVLADGGDTFMAEYRVARSDGTWASVMDRAHIARDRDGRPRRLVGAIADVSEQRALEAQLRHAQKMEAVGQLAGGVAHDFNNLLSVILGSAELVRAAVPPNSALAADLDEITRAARRGAQLTRQLLAFSRRQVLRPRLLDLVAVVRGAEPLLRRLLPETVTLDLVLPDTPHVVHADPGQLEQVLMNLVVNARDAVVAAGRTPGLVQVTVDRTTAGRCPAEVAAMAAGGSDTTPSVRLTVRDDGIGMDAATRSRAFEPFFTTKAPGRGTGLGLATAFGIAAQSGGTMCVESAPGEGATFALLLPSAGEVAPAAEAARGSAAPPSVGETVLLVEDEIAVRNTARRVLERHGYHVLEARHGADALMLWDERDGTIDVVLTDLRMPEMGGGELLTQLRARRPTLPAVLMSGYVQAPLPADRVPGPPVRTLDKPFTPEQLLQAVRRALDAGVLKA